MYIRKSSRTYNGKTYFNYVLVESVLTHKGPRQKVICSLGDLRPRPRAEWLELAPKLASALSGQPDLRDGAESAHSPSQRTGHAGLDPFDGAAGYFGSGFPGPGRRRALP